MLWVLLHNLGIWLLNLFLRDFEEFEQVFQDIEKEDEVCLFIFLLFLFIFFSLICYLPWILKFGELCAACFENLEQFWSVSVNLFYFLPQMGYWDSSLSSIDSCTCGTLLTSFLRLLFSVLQLVQFPGLRRQSTPCSAKVAAQSLWCSSCCSCRACCILKEGNGTR